MTLMQGARVGPYEVLNAIGSGGMGEVYRARDPKLNRDVALKVLPAAFVTDPDRLARFRREAQVLASLSHANVAHIYGVEDDGPVHALVLELVEGPTLADRIRLAPIAIDDALAIARQIAMALEAAHDHGVIHRDLKPANIKIKDDGTVKVLDFGLAKALGSDAVAAPPDDSPTLTNRATALGIVLGTAAYMAPEQAKGKVVDTRADIWSFGVVLFEMLSGRRLFRGDDISDTIADVLRGEPDWNVLPRDTPPMLRQLLRRCLQKDPKQRLRDIADVRLVIEEIIATPAETAPAPGMNTRSVRRERIVWLSAMAGVLIASAIAMTLLMNRPAAVNAPETRLEIVTPPGNPMALALSPDGRTLAFSARVAGRNLIWLRPLDAEVAHPIPGTEQAGAFSWTPDGKSLRFNQGRMVKLIDVTGGTARALPDETLGGFGMTRNADGSMLTAPANAAQIVLVPTGGGARTDATRVVPPQVGHRYPYFLPDGRHFVFLATGTSAVQGIYLGTLGSLEAKRIARADTAPAFVSPNYVLFGRQDTVYAQALNLSTLEPEGEPFVVADSPAQARNIFGSIALTVSHTGTIAYRKASIPVHRLMWVDRTGKELGTIGDVETTEFDGQPHLSPDGRTIAVTRRVNGNTDIWTIDNAPAGAFQRLTSDDAFDSNSVWSPDGTRIAFQSARRGGGTYDLFQKTFGGSGGYDGLLESADNKTMSDWSRDNRFMLFQLQTSKQVARDIWALPLFGDDRTPFAVTTTNDDELTGRFSPDGKWVSYQSNEAGARPDVYIRPFPGPGRAWRITSEGGTAAAWGRDNRELFYLGPDNRVMVVPLTLSADGKSVERGTPVGLFPLRAGSTFEPARDGQRFLVNAVVEDPPTPSIVVILNWAGRRK